MQGFGLVGLLVVVAIVFYLMFGAGGKGSAGQALETKKEAEQKINAFSGRDENSKPASDSIQFDTNDKGILVVAVTPDGALSAKYGLRAGDLIVEVGPLVGREIAADAKGTLNFAFARNEPLAVIRDGARLKLPLENAAPVAPQPERATPRGQLDSILKGRPDGGVPTH